MSKSWNSVSLGAVRLRVFQVVSRWRCDSNVLARATPCKIRTESYHIGAVPSRIISALPVPQDQPLYWRAHSTHWLRRTYNCTSACLQRQTLIVHFAQQRSASPGNHGNGRLRARASSFSREAWNAHDMAKTGLLVQLLQSHCRVRWVRLPAAAGRTCICLVSSSSASICARSCTRCHPAARNLPSQGTPHTCVPLAGGRGRNSGGGRWQHTPCLVSLEHRHEQRQQRRQPRRVTQRKGPGQTNPSRNRWSPHAWEGHHADHWIRWSPPPRPFSRSRA
jgi:hypothetical protein